jgi:hypothetical protein
MNLPHPPEPAHVPGTTRGEEMTFKKGREGGRGGRKSYREARDSTGIDPGGREPILPAMPHLPPS